MKISLACCISGLTLGLSTFSHAGPANWRGQSITEFEGAEKKGLRWQVVNDGVMGGLSKGNVKITEAETMKFFGTLSLENNGGFSTVRSSQVDLNLSNDLGVLLNVRGDGRTYEIRFESDALYRGRPVSFAGKFTPTGDSWQQIKIPFSDFKGSWRGTNLPKEKLNPADIRQVGILLGDKKNGPFDLEMEWIRTYGKGQGNYIERTTGSQTKDESSDELVQLIPTIEKDGRFEVMKTALDLAGLTPFFQWDNKMTVFAPTDDAFAKLPEGVLEDLLKPENKQKLIAILSYHVAAGSTDVAAALSAGSVDPVKGPALKVAFSDGRVRVNGAAVIDGNIECSDGVIHAIDSVLLPPAAKDDQS